MAVTKKPDYRDLEKFVVKVNGQDVTKFMLDLKVYQDMFIPYYTGTLDLFDTFNLSDKIKIGDLVKIEMKTKQGFNDTDGELKISLVVFNISGRISDKHNSQYFTLHLATKQFQKDLEERVSQAFINKKPQDIINECLGKIGSSIEEYIKRPPTNKVSYVAPNVTPLIVCNTVLRSTTPQPDYFLYPSKNDTSGNNLYTLGSLTDLFKEEPVITFNQGIYNTSQSRFQNQNLQIRTPHIKQIDDLTNRLIGYNANTLNTMDINDRKWDSKGRNFQGKGSASVSIAFQPVAKETFEQGQSLPESSKQWAQERKNAFFRVMQFPISFSTFGHCKSWDWFSKIVNLDLAHNNIDKRKPTPYELLKGKPMLVTAVTHHINHRKEYRNSFRVVSWEIKPNA